MHIQLPFKLGGKTYGVGDQLPYNQIERVIDPKKILGQTTPFIKVPYEVATGQYAYTGMDVDGTGGYMANQTFFTKMINVARNIEDPVQRRAYVVGQLIGFPIGKIEN